MEPVRDAKHQVSHLSGGSLEDHTFTPNDLLLPRSLQPGKTENPCASFHVIVKEHWKVEESRKFGPAASKQEHP